MNICVYGASSKEIKPIYLEQSKLVGQLLAKSNHTVVYGGGKYGVMGAIAKGVTEEGGSLIGIAPTFFIKQQVLYEQCTEFHHTQTMHERKQKMAELADIFLMMPGGIGTYEEFFEALTWKHLNLHDKPILIFNVNHYFDPLIKSIQKAIDEAFLCDSRSLFEVFECPEELLTYIEKGTG